MVKFVRSSRACRYYVINHMLRKITFFKNKRTAAKSNELTISTLMSHNSPLSRLLLGQRKMMALQFVVMRYSSSILNFETGAANSTSLNSIIFVTKLTWKSKNP